LDGTFPADEWFHMGTIEAANETNDNMSTLCIMFLGFINLSPDEKKNPMPRIHFHQQHATLKDKLLAMAALSQQILSLALEAYLTGDMGLCEHVKEIENAIDAAEREVDGRAYDLLAKEQPMAIDLRFILSVIKITGDLEHRRPGLQHCAARRGPERPPKD